MWFSYLEFGQLLFVDGICFGNDGDDIDLAVQLLHAHQVNGLESVPVGGDEVEAHVDPWVMEGGEISLDLQLLLQVALKLRIDVIHDRLKTVLFVNLIAVAHRIANRELWK